MYSLRLDYYVFRCKGGPTTGVGSGNAHKSHEPHEEGGGENGKGVASIAGFSTPMLSSLHACPTALPTKVSHLDWLIMFPATIGH